MKREECAIKMNVLFLTLVDFESVNEKNIYTDLIREFSNNNNSVYVVSPVERKKRQKTKIFIDNNITVLKPQIGNIQKTNIIEKGVATITLEKKIISAIKKYFNDVVFDLIIYSTPPITFQKAVKYIKKRDNAYTYLLLKDIFPQNAIDLGLLSKRGKKAPIYYYFRNKEKKLYEISDYIGCMSKANVDYVLNNNPEISTDIVGVCPNSIEITDIKQKKDQKNVILEKYNIPVNKKIFIYGGNLGKPQGIPHLIECLKEQLKNSEVFYLIIGDGTEYNKLEEFFLKFKPVNMYLMHSISKNDFDELLTVCDIGMVFLDHRFTIPNFPSRALSYMQAGLPILACTDTSTDFKDVIINGGFGWWCESNSVQDFKDTVKNICKSDIESKSFMSRKYLVENYDVKKSYNLIIDSLENMKIKNIK